MIALLATVVAITGIRIGQPMLLSPNVRFGSKADICSAMGHVRFTPESGHVQCNQGCPLWANSNIASFIGSPRRRGRAVRTER
jgi:hypothetical protein